MQKQFLLSLYILFSSTLTLTQANAGVIERCKSIQNEIKKAHWFYFGVDFPFWYSVAQAETESLCRHSILSSDGIGSEGFAQITFRWWRDRLAKEGIHEIGSVANHAKAQAFINRYEYERTACRRLFEMYQRYNGGDLVSRELKKANSCKWEDGYKICKRKNICVLTTKTGCKQYRNTCNINYEYSIKIYEKAQKYRIYSDRKFAFW